LITKDSGVASGEYTYVPIERVYFGSGSIRNLRNELDRIGSKRPFLVTGQSVAKKTDLIAIVEHASGRKLAGVFSEIRQHAPMSGITRAATAAREAKADSLRSSSKNCPRTFGFPPFHTSRSPQLSQLPNSHISPE
jgi:hypothetical protein